MRTWTAQRRAVASFRPDVGAPGQGRPILLRMRSLGRAAFSFLRPIWDDQTRAIEKDAATAMTRSQPATPLGTAPARTLAMSTVAFTVCFAVWTIFSIIGL